MNYEKARQHVKRHKARVAALLGDVIAQLEDRARQHDDSKLFSPELEAVVRLIEADAEYGTPEYFETMRSMADQAEHHYAFNRHHPEHYPDGVAGMTLIDLLEMVSDWVAVAKDIDRSLDINRDRFGYDEQLDSVIRNTVDLLLKRNGYDFGTKQQDQV